MLITHKICLNPTAEQETYFKKASGIARFTYNWALGEWKKSRNDGKKKSLKELKNSLNENKKGSFSVDVRSHKMRRGIFLLRFTKSAQ